MSDTSINTKIFENHRNRQPLISTEMTQNYKYTSNKKQNI